MGSAHKMSTLSLTSTVSKAPSIRSNSSNSSSRQFDAAHDLLMCDICLEQYDDGPHEAKFLACHHSFCVACLTQLMTGGSSGGEASNGSPTPKPRQVECPSCRHVTILTDAGINGLQTNFYIAYMRETFAKIGQPKVKGCSKHSNQPMSFFCQKCGTSICRDCTVLDHKESEGHTLQDITAAETEQRQGLATKMENGRHVLNILQDSMQNLETELDNMTVVKELVLKELDQVFDRCMKMLEFRKLQLAKSVFDQYNKKQEMLLRKGDEVSGSLKDLSVLIGLCERLIKSGPLAEVVAISRNLSSSMEDLKTRLDTIDLGKNYITFDSQTGLSLFEESLCRYGKIVASGGLPTKAKFTMNKLIACHRTTISIEISTHCGDKLSKYPIALHIIDPKNSYLPNEIQAQGDEGVYTVTFLPQISGEHRLVPTFHGHPIKGAEKKVTVQSNNPILKFGENGKGYGKFCSPRAVAIDKEKCLYIADTGNKLIQRVDSDGNFLYQFCVNNKEHSSTCDLALNETQRLILCTETIIGSGFNPTTGNSIIIYNMEGQVQDVYSNKVMKCALCISTNSRGDIIVSDYLVHSLFMYSKTGTFLRRIGHAGRFNHPAFITIGGDDSIIVSDTNNDCIHVFDGDGNFRFQFGVPGNGKGELKQPFGVATDGENILVVDSGNHRIQVFSMDGTFVSMIESLDDPLNQPRGMAVTDNGYLYVADRDNHCIKKYKYK